MVQRRGAAAGSPPMWQNIFTEYFIAPNFLSSNLSSSILNLTGLWTDKFANFSIAQCHRTQTACVDTKSQFEVPHNGRWYPWSGGLLTGSPLVSVDARVRKKRPLDLGQPRLVGDQCTFGACEERNRYILALFQTNFGALGMSFQSSEHYWRTTIDNWNAMKEKSLAVEVPYKVKYITNSEQNEYDTGSVSH